MNALIETLETPDGPLIIVADPDQNVLAAGWTTDASAVIARIHPTLRPTAVAEASLEAGDAARAYYGGAIGAIDSVRVRQHGTELQRKGWAALREIPAGSPLTYTQFAAAFGSPDRRACGGIRVRSQRTRPVRAVPSGVARRRHAGRIRLGSARQGEPAGARERRSAPRDLIARAPADGVVALAPGGPDS